MRDWCVIDAWLMRDWVEKVLQYSLSTPPLRTLRTTVDLYCLAAKWLKSTEPTHFIALYHTFPGVFRDSACAQCRSKRGWENLLTLSHIVTADTVLIRDCVYCNSTMGSLLYSVYTAYIGASGYTILSSISQPLNVILYKLLVNCG